MKRNVFNILFLLVFVSVLNAQTAQVDILFTVDEDPIFVDEFKRVYNKNLELVKDESQKDVDTYLDLFINYKLKLKEAFALKLHETPKYKREFASYKKQLAKNYLTDSRVTETLVKEAYDRVANEIKASHILIRVSENASPEDTLVAYNKLIDARHKIINGANFVAIAKEYSQDPSAAENGGDLGYFGGFRMVYNFESAAFNTPIGEVSMPFRTRFGYHIVKTFDKRKSEGEVTVAHIMISKKQKDSLTENPKKRIQDIYKKLQQGEKFESLAKQFSEDKASAKKGGVLNKFGKGQLSSTVFEDIAFKLTSKEDVSLPFETNFGWHIVKLLDKHPVASFENMKKEIEVKVKRDSRSRIINKAFADSLKRTYRVSISASDIEKFTAILNEDFYKRSWQVPDNFNKDEVLFKMVDETIKTGDFANYLLQYQRKMRTKKPLQTIVKNALNEFSTQKVLAYHEDNLEQNNTDFAFVVNEYRDGLLLFDLMESEIWNAAKKDSVGLLDFYNKNTSNYVWPKRIVATVASSANKGVTKKVSKYLKKGWDVSKIKATLNKGEKLNVIFTADTMTVNHQALPKNFQFNEGVSDVYQHNDNYIVVEVDEIIESKPKVFEDARGKVVSDYQEFIEKQWLEGLRKKYKVEVHQEVLQKVKETIN